MTKCDLAIIGSGPGGYVAALRAAHLQKKVCIIEKAHIGGACLNSGCIPTKAYAASRDALHKIRSASSFGIDVGSVSADFKKIFERKNKIVKETRDGVARLLKGNGIQIIKGSGKLASEDTVIVEEDGKETKIQADYIMLATGSKPASPADFKIDHENVITSTDALRMDTLPKEMIILGGGVIGCELASIFNAFGVDVTIIELMPTILMGIDPQIVSIIKSRFKELGIKTIVNAKVENVAVSNGKAHVSILGGETLTANKVLVSIGRTPNTSGIGLKELGIELVKGKVVVDTANKTNIKNIFAIGDITDGPMLAHKASYDGICAVHSAFGIPFTKLPFSSIPAVAFTDPEIASVGITEAKAKEAGIECAIGRFSYSGSSKAACMGETKGLIKIVAKKNEGIIIGAAICGYGASDLIYGLGVAINLKLRGKDIYGSVFPHPTISEGIKEALEDIDELSAHKIR